MTLDAGTQLGSYEILSPLGAGGMGEVYRARDTKLERDVAIKVLPEEFHQNRERLARFQREAKLLAALNHANVATLYGLETANGQPFLVMELIEGETLAELIQRGPLSVEEATRLFIQIAEGLGAAHEKGIIHRDLKPANIKITPEGIVKILDFGLAKAFAPEDEPALSTSQSPTLTRGTALGVIMGTAFYMSPEQARGKVVDKRTDIWAFGCCLFEALSGQKAFDGEVATDVLGAIIHKEPDWNVLSTQAPRRIIEKCLKKDKRDRLQDIGDVRIALEEPASAPRRAVAPRRLALVLATLLGMALGAGLLWRFGGDTNRALPEPKRFAVSLNEGERLGDFFATADNPIAFSPDGSHLVYAAARGSTSHLYVRDMSTSETSRIPKTNGATDPFFSPDGRWIGFFAKSRLRKVRLAGGEPEIIAEWMGWTQGATWGPAGSIVFAGLDELYVVSEDGGEPERVTTGPNDRLPKFLPDGKRILFTTALPGEEEQIAILNIETREQSLLAGLGRSSSGMYLDSGHLVFARGSDLLVTEFERADARVRGEARLMASGVFATRPGRAYFDVSRNGDLAFVLGDPAARSLVLVDRSGREEPVTQGQYMHPAFLFDGKRLRVMRNGGQDLWEFDIERSAAARTDTWLTSHDGRMRVFRGDDLVVELMETGERTVLASGGAPDSWSRDGQWIALGLNRGADLGVINVDSGEPPTVLLDSPYKEISGMFSPDGRYLAYVTDESGRDEVHVVSFSDTSRKWAVTNDECNQPLWWGDEIFFRCGDRALSLEVETDPEFRVMGEPELMFEGPYDYGEAGDSHWDISPDGERFAMIRLEEASRPRQIEIVLNWRTLVHRAFETSP